MDTDDSKKIKKLNFHMLAPPQGGVQGKAQALGLGAFFAIFKWSARLF